jgi:hypothetical protein
VRRTLETVVEQETQPLEDKLKERLVDIIKQYQTQLETMFQATSGASASPLAFDRFDSLPDRTTTHRPDLTSSLDNNNNTSLMVDTSSLPGWHHDTTWLPDPHLSELPTFEPDVTLPYTDVNDYSTFFEQSPVIETSAVHGPST